MGFEHLIITRFNVRVSDTAAGEDWLRHRLDYFNTVCAPSIRSQTNKDFRWLVLFDSIKEMWFGEEIARLSEDGSFEPIWVDGPMTPEWLGATIASFSNAEWLITSRVDNDDAVSRDFVDLVQSQFALQNFEFINFQSGLQLTDSGELFHRLDPSSAFISLVEKRNGSLPKTVYLASHSEVAHHGTVRQVRSHPTWLQMIHGRNMANEVLGVRADPTLLAKHFDIKVPASEMSRGELMASKAKSAAALALRVLEKPSRLSRLGAIARNKIRTLSK